MFCIAVAQAGVENGLHHDLNEWHVSLSEVTNVPGDCGCLVADGATEFGCQDVGDVTERDGARATQYIAFVDVSFRFAKNIGRHFAQIANVDESDTSVSRRHEEAVVFADVISVSVAKVLGEKAWSQNGERNPGGRQVRFNSVVGHDSIGVGSGDGRKDNVLDAVCAATSISWFSVCFMREMGGGRSRRSASQPSTAASKVDGSRKSNWVNSAVGNRSDTCRMLRSAALAVMPAACSAVMVADPTLPDAPVTRTRFAEVMWRAAERAVAIAVGHESGSESEPY